MEIMAKDYADALVMTEYKETGKWLGRLVDRLKNEQEEKCEKKKEEWWM